jgi:hypothetical protein
VGLIKLKEADLLQCCGSAEWSKQMAAHTFPNVKEVFATGDSIWWSLGPAAWKAAFGAHSKITAHASEHALEELHALTQQYEERFGYSFIYCSTGKTAHAILESLRARVGNDPDAEVRIAAEEQRQINHLRLKRLLGPFTSK